MRSGEKKRLILLEGICLLSLIFLAVVACRERNRSTLFVPPSFEREAKQGEPQPAAGTDLVPVEVEEGFRAKVNGALRLKEGKTDVWLTAPEDNTVWLKLRIYDEKGNLLGESGILKPGQYVQSVSLSGSPGESEPVTLKLMAYTPDTWYSAGTAVLHTTLEVEE